MSKDAYYFPHDAGARNDLKIVGLRRKHDWAGVGIYWAIVEMLREANEDDYKIRCSQIEDIAYDLRFNASIFKDLINGDPENSLLVSDGEWFWSESLIRRMFPLDEKRRKLSEAGKKGGRPKKKATLKPGLNQVKGQPKPNESNKSRVDQSKEDKKERNTPSRKSRKKKPSIPLPSDWKPSEGNIKTATDLDVNIDWEVEKFRDNALSKDLEYVDWSRAFSTWLRRSVEFNKGKSVPAPKPKFTEEELKLGREYDQSIVDNPIR